MAKVDMESPEFKRELEKTIEFTNKVVKQFGFVFNPNADIVEGIQQGLTRHKVLYNKRYCPCFFVTQTPEDRICPCKPALDHEIKEDGCCHCQIFCTPEYAKAQEEAMATEEQKKKSDALLSKEECEELLSKSAIACVDFEKLINARNAGICHFLLVDVREQMEYDRYHIKGTDFHIPASEFNLHISKLAGKENEPIVTYCASGGRSAYCNHIKRSMGFTNVINLADGIIGYKGEIER